MAERFVTYETENPGMLVDPDGIMRPVVMINNPVPSELSINVTFEQLYAWFMDFKPIIVLCLYLTPTGDGVMKPMAIRYNVELDRFIFIDLASDEYIYTSLVEITVSNTFPKHNTIH